ncbi:MAG: FkbM family methyltransferase [Nitrospirae bacterium]|nr:FkbM family methyltransferase [Nitrospirota bacterium]
MLRQYIKQGDVVLDIGANIGFYARILSQLAGSTGQIHCFEPDPLNFTHLIKNTLPFKNIKLINKAVGAETGVLKIYTSKSLNVDHRTYKPDVYDREIEIQAVSIDEYLANNKRVDFVKIDIQGFEMQAIKGMEKTLRHNKTIKLLSEFWPYGLRKAGSSLSQYYNFLKDMGFEVFLLEIGRCRNITAENVKRLEDSGEEHYFNIFVKRDNGQGV